MIAVQQCSSERRRTVTYQAPKLQVLGSIAELTLAGRCKQIAPLSDGTFVQIHHKRFDLNHCTS
jgi:hypothetical protein